MELFSTITEKEFFISSFSKKHMKNIMAPSPNFQQSDTLIKAKTINKQRNKHNKNTQHIDTVKSGWENFCSFLQHSLGQQLD